MTCRNRQNKCALREYSGQSGALPSLIRVFSVRSVGVSGSKLSVYW